MWYSLLDRCLILASGMPLAGEVSLLLVFQVCAGAFLLTLISRGFPTATAAEPSSRSLRMNLIVFMIPSVFFLLSPAILSEVLNRERYGINKFVVHAHVARDLRCCVNPLSTSPSSSGSD